MASPLGSDRPKFSLRLLLALFAAVAVACVPVALSWRYWPETLLLIFWLGLITILCFQRNKLYFYCRYLNPAVALLVFFLCFHAASWNESGDYRSLIGSEPIPRYFFAKGIFAGMAVFLLGKVLETMLDEKFARQQSLEPSD
jgi:hypothetical protein